MDRSRRQFLTGVGAVVGGTAMSQILGPTSAGAAQDVPLTNWAGNLTYGIGRLHSARSVEDVQAFVRAHDRLKVLGTRTASTTSPTAHELLSVREMNQVVARSGGADGDDRGRHELRSALPLLDQKVSRCTTCVLPHISVAGAAATATHGSGVRNGNLATAVSSFEFVTAAGDVVQLSRDKDPRRSGAVVNLGALGVVTKVTLDVQPTFRCGRTST
jgi:xylitol oxidase